MTTSSRSLVSSALDVQRKLQAHYESLLSSDFCQLAKYSDYTAEISTLENQWNAFEEGRIADWALPSTVQDFPQWYNDIATAHTQTTTELFDYLANEATMSEMAYFICLEERVDSHFEDLMALAQLGADYQVKQVIADNYSDEMGRGIYDDIHAVMFSRCVSYMKEQLRSENIGFYFAEPIEALKNSNVLLMYALRPKWRFRLIGALGVLEHTASIRFAGMTQGLSRLNVPEEVMRYQATHVSVDQSHASEWFNHVLLPLVEKDEKLMLEICTGVLIRYKIATDYYSSVTKMLQQNKIKNLGGA